MHMGMNTPWFGEGISTCLKKQKLQKGADGIATCRINQSYK